MVQSKQTLGPESGAGESFDEVESYAEAAPTLRIPAIQQPKQWKSAPWNGPPTPPGSTASYPAVVVPLRRAEEQRSERDRRRPAPLVLRLFVVLLALCTVGAVGGVVALHERPNWFVGLRNVAPSSPIRHAVSPPRPAPTSALPPSTGAGNLTISALKPATGASGSQVTILGGHLFGPGGYLVATFDGSPVPTSCPSESECIATVPPASLGTTATVRLETHTGMSNGLRFRYR